MSFFAIKINKSLNEFKKKMKELSEFVVSLSSLLKIVFFSFSSLK